MNLPTAAIRIKSLDGIRAVAIAMVMMSHAVNHTGVRLPWIEGTLAGAVLRDFGRLGVMTFFVLSGYLITTLLLAEYERRGTVSIANFWYRRAFRIFPVFYAYLIVVGLLAARGSVDLTPGAFAVAATYTWNYQFLFIDWRHTGQNTDILGHLWSLAVEEQFYLVFPLILAAAGPRKTFWICAALVATTPPLRLLQYYLFPSIRDFGGTMGHSMFGATIAIGCLWPLSRYANVGVGLRVWAASRRCFCTALIVGFVLHPILAVLLRAKWTLPVGELLFSTCVVFCIAYLVANSDSSFTARLLNLRPVVWLGVVSYSVYIWQQLYYCYDMIDLPPPASRVVYTVLAIATGAASYYLLERPLLRLRDQLLPSKREVVSTPLVTEPPSVS